MHKKKCHILVFLMVSTSMAGCLSDETRQNDDVYDTELESRNQTIDDLQSQLDQSLMIVESLQDGWETTNQSLLDAINNAELAQKEILELQMGWQSANQTLVQLEKEWANYNASVDQYLDEWSQANATIVGLENDLR